jgi:hypothetical protein
VVAIDDRVDLIPDRTHAFVVFLLVDTSGMVTLSGISGLLAIPRRSPPATPACFVVVHRHQRLDTGHQAPVGAGNAKVS